MTYCPIYQQNKTFRSKPSLQLLMQHLEPQQLLGYILGRSHEHVPTHSLMWCVVLRMRGEMSGSVIRGNYLWSPTH